MPLVTIPKKELTSFDLPPICVISGATEGVVWKKRKFQWYPPWVAGFAFSPPLMIIVGLIMMKRAEGELPFTETTWKELQRAQILRGVAILMGVFSFFVALGVLAADMPILAALIFVLMLGGAIWIGIKYVKNRTPIPKKITDDIIEIEIPSDVAARAFHERLYGNRQPQQPPQSRSAL